MQNVIVKVGDFLGSCGWKCAVEPDKPIIHTTANGKNGRWPCVAIGGNENEHLLFLSILPINVPVEKRQPMAELLTRINYQLTHGCYEMDFEDGEIRFRTSVPVFSGEISEETLEYLVFANLCTFDNHVSLIMRVVFGNTPPQKVLQTVKTKKARKPRKPRFELN